jgi:hypothetical protein
MALVLWRFVLALVLSFCAVAAIAPRQAPAADVNVYMDEAKLLRLPETVATIVVGNPLIADVSLQPGGFMVVTGKSYGTTNLIMLDRSGNVLMSNSIDVRGPHGAVVVYRGGELPTRETYICQPNCQRRLTPGDATEFFDLTLNQGLNRAGAAAGAAPSQPTMSVPPPPVTFVVPKR